MSLPLFFLDPTFFTGRLAEADDGKPVVVRLTAEDAKHLAVLRVRAGEHAVLSDGRGGAFEVELVEPAARSGQTCLVRLIAPVELPYRPNLTLVQGVSKGERMDLLVRQSVEIGVARIIPALTARCIVRLDERKRAARGERWRSIARSAAKQSGQPLVPEVDDPIDFRQAVELAAGKADVVVVPWEESRSGAMSAVLREVPRDACVFLFIGPEGGFEESEVEALRAIGAHVITLGDTILRTETAGVIASALAIYELGGLGNGGAADA